LKQTSVALKQLLPCLLARIPILLNLMCAGLAGSERLFHSPVRHQPTDIAERQQRNQKHFDPHGSPRPVDYQSTLGL
jgi:hypothetical protein